MSCQVVFHVYKPILYKTNLIYPHFTKEETEAQRDICTGPLSLQVARPELKPWGARLFISRALHSTMWLAA